MRYGFIAIKVLLTLAFVGAGSAKLMGVEMMVQTFDTIGWGQWFRYVTAAIEVGGAALLWVKGREAIGAGLLVATMGAAVLFHLLVLGPSLIPALVLGGLAAVILWQNKGQLVGA